MEKSYSPGAPAAQHSGIPQNKRSAFGNSTTNCACNLEKKRVIIYITSKQRKERIDMKDIKYPVYGDVDDLIFVGETWSESER